MPPREGGKVVLLEKVVYALSKEFGDNADMIAIVEPL